MYGNKLFFCTGCTHIAYLCIFVICSVVDYAVIIITYLVTVEDMDSNPISHMVLTHILYPDHVAVWRENTHTHSRYCSD